MTHSSVGRHPMSAQPRPYSSHAQVNESETADINMDRGGGGGGGGFGDGVGVGVRSGIKVGVGVKLVLVLGEKCCSVFRVSSWRIFKIIQIIK